MQKGKFTDQMGRQISLDFLPKRIISLVPSQTELLSDLGLDKEIIGITKFCIYPQDKFKRNTKVGGTKKLDLDKIRALKPDLIIGNKEENDQSQLEELMLEFPVWMSDITLIEDALEMIESIGEITGKTENALQIVANIQNSLAKIPQNVDSNKRVAYFIWKDPYMLAGKNTFINSVLERAGFDNAIDLMRYPAMSISEIKDLKPELIFLSSEPYPFKNQHVDEMSSHFPDAKVLIVDGELFSWYGSRLQFTADYLSALLGKI